MISFPQPGDPAPRAAPENVLYRSRTEIGRIMQRLAEGGCSVSTVLGGNEQFVSRLLAVNLVSGHFYIAYSANKLLNSALFARPATEFTTTYEGNHFVFPAANPSASLYEGQPAIRFTLPVSLLRYHQHERPPVAAAASEISLRCIADEGGFLPFEARIIDISLDGIGSMLYDKDIVLDPDVPLKACRIIIPNESPVITDAKVLNTVRVTLPDGTVVNRASLSFLQLPEKIDALINVFIQDLDVPASRRQ